MDASLMSGDNSTTSSSTTALLADGGLSVCSSENDGNHHHIGVTGTNLSQFCIGDIEPQLHKTFAAGRCPSEEYVYIPTEEMFKQLDDFCDEASMHYPSSPLVICGQPGVGKSALLSNWRTRKHTARRKYTDNGDVTASHHRPFIFWHVAGCSRISCHVPHMLRRLMTELKAHFDLTREVSKDEDRLRWDLPTFLEMAARKGPVILIIDGVHRMRDEEGEEDLKWLPLDYPGNVRLIVSTTVYKEDGGNMSARKNKSLTELKRRQWEMMEVKEMSNKTRKEVMTSFLKLTSQFATTTTDDAVSSLHDGSLLSKSRCSSEPLLLFPSQQKLILNSPASCNPLYLRVLLSALHWSANRGFDLWRVIPDWTQAESMSELYDRILNTWETGMLVSTHAVQDAEANLLREGGYYTLLRKHPWLARSSDGSTSPVPINGREQEHEDEDMNKPKTARSDELPLAETLCRKVHADAEQAILNAKASAEKAMADLLAQAQGLNKPKEGTDQKRPQLPRYDNEQMVEFFTHQGDFSKPKPPQSAPKSTRSDGSGDNKMVVKGVDDERGEDFDEEGAKEYITLNLDNLGELDDMSLLQPSSSTEQGKTSSGTGGTGTGTGTGTTSSNGSSGKNGKSSTSEEDNHASALMGMQITMDGPDDDAAGRRDQIQLVPWYLRGGRHVEGFGSTLGNALAVLYVARHGLTTTELTKLLLKLRERSDKRLCSTIWRQRGLIRELLEDMDKEGSGYLPLQDLHALICNIDNRLRSGKLDNLVQVSGSSDESGLVSYEILIEYCGAVFRNEKGERKIQKEESDALKALSLDTTSTGPDHGMEEALLEILMTLGVMYSQPNQVMVLTLESETLRDVVQHRYVKGSDGLQRWHNAIMKYFQTQPSTMRRCEELPWHLCICRRWKSLKDALSDLWAFELMYLGKLKTEFFEYWRILTEGPLYITEAAEKDHVVEQSSAILSDIDTATVLGLTESRGQKEKLRGQMATFDMIECYNKAVEHWRIDVRPSTHRLASMLNLIAQFMAEFSEVVRFNHPPPKFLRKPLDWESMQQIGIDEIGFVPKREKTQVNAGASVSSDARIAASALAADTASYYHFKRWMWIQFPWMALANTKLAMQLFASNYQVITESSKSSGLELTSQLGISASPSSPSHAPKSPDSSLTGKIRVVDPTATFKRMWMVKKMDPLRDKSASFSKHSFHSMLNSCVDGLAPAAQVSERLVQSAYKDKAAVAFRMANRKFDAKPRDHSLPYSQSSFRSLKHGTRVPTVEQIYKQNLQEQADNMDVVAASAIHRFGGIRNPSTVEELMERESDNAIISGTASLGSISAHSYAMPITAKEKVYIDARARVASLRGVLDKLRAERGRMWARYKELQLAAVERDNQDAVTIEKLRAGEYVIDALQARLIRIQAAVQEGEALGGFYRLVIEQCRVNPAKDVKRLECLDQQMSLAKIQLLDLIRQRHRVYLEKEHLEKEEIVKANLHLERIIKDRKRATQKMQALARRPPADTAPEPKRNNTDAQNNPGDRRNTAVSRPFGLTSTIDMNRRNTRGDLDHTKNTLGATHLRAEKIQKAMEKLFELAGTETCEGVLDKMHNSEKLHEGLMDQCKDYEMKVAELKTELQRTEKKLQDVNVDTSDEANKGVGEGANGQTAGEQSAEAKELHNMDDSIFLEEMRAIKNRRAMLNAHQFLDQVKTGVNHLARLAAKYSVHLPVMALRAPDGLHEEKYDDNEMAKILGVFEERITAMKESLALEAGDPKIADGSGRAGSFADELPIHGIRRRGAPDITQKRLSSVFGIDTDAVLTLKKEKEIMSRVVDAMSRLQPGNKALKASSTKYKVCIKAMAALDSMYESSVAELQRKEDEQQSRAEAEAETKAIEIKGGTENFIRSALSSKESQVALRRTVLRELDKGCRQFPENDEGLGIAIEDALLDSNVYIGKLWGPGADDPKADKKGSTSNGGTAGPAAAMAPGPAIVTSRAPTSGNNQVLDRESLKALSNNIIAKRKRQEMKALLATKAAQEAGEESEGGNNNNNNNTLLLKERE